MNILLVEDDKRVAAFIVAQLSAAGHTCVHALDGEAGNQAASAGNYDVMVIDRMVPGVEGLPLNKPPSAPGNKKPVAIPTHKPH